MDKELLLVRVNNNYSSNKYFIFNLYYSGVCDSRHSREYLDCIEDTDEFQEFGDGYLFIGVG